MKKIITCHCKNIKISVVFPEIITPVKCNCSICQRRNAKMAVVEKKDVKVLFGSEFIKSYKLLNWSEAIKKLHNSEDSKNIQSQSFRRIVFDEICANYLTLSENRKRVKKRKKGKIFN